jgi:hypothetical protein
MATTTATTTETNEAMGAQAMNNDASINSTSTSTSEQAKTKEEDASKPQNNETTATTESKVESQDQPLDQELEKVRKSPGMRLSYRIVSYRLSNFFFFPHSFFHSPRSIRNAKSLIRYLAPAAPKMAGPV